jgi:putative hydrolase of the HAD superfamily
MLETVVFDLDGTLFDHRSAARAGLAGWLASIGRTLTDDAVSAWADAEAKHFRSWCDGEISFVEQRRRRLRDVLPALDHPVGDDAALDASFALYLTGYRAAWSAYDDVAAALDALSAVGTAVLTNGSTEQQEAKIAAMGLRGRLGPVVTAEEIGVAKPRPEAFHAVCERLAVQPEHALYVGDDHAADVLGARAAGMHAVHLDRAGTCTVPESSRIARLDLLVDLLTEQRGCL